VTIDQGVAETEKLASHHLRCLADCGIVMPPTVEAYVSILVLAVVIALAWVWVRRLTRRRKRVRPSGD